MGSDPSPNLRNRELFQVFDASEIEEIEQLLAITEPPDGTTIIQAGKTATDLERAIHIVITGEVSVSTTPTAANQVPVARILKPGEIFGLVAFVTDGRHTASCTAKGPVRIASLPRRSLDALANGREALAAKIFQVICGQLARDLRACDRRLANALHKRLEWGDLPSFVSR